MEGTGRNQKGSGVSESIPGVGWRPPPPRAFWPHAPPLLYSSWPASSTASTASENAAAVLILVAAGAAYLLLHFLEAPGRVSVTEHTVVEELALSTSADGRRVLATVDGDRAGVALVDP